MPLLTLHTQVFEIESLARAFGIFALILKNGDWAPISNFPAKIRGVLDSTAPQSR